MKKLTLLITACCIVVCALCQQESASGTLSGGWKLIKDPTNPAVNFSTPGQYKGVAWVDVNRDGYIDLFAAPSKLFINNGLGNFIEKATIIGNTPAKVASGTSWADIDNDGDIDCLLAYFPSGVYLNDGNSNFENKTDDYPFLKDYAAWGCAAGNQGKNGKLDILFVHARGFHAGPWQTCRYYSQRPAGIDPHLTGAWDFLTSLNPYTVPYWSDYDLDGDMDLFIASGPGGSPGFDFCYKNMLKETGNEELVRMTAESFAQQLQDGQCYNFVDIDNDQDLDLCLTNYIGANTRLYRNTNGMYDTLVTPFSQKRINLANCWGDYDNDGDLDVVISNDFRPLEMFINDGNGNFVLDTNGVTTPRPVTGVANCDYDNDGDLDFFTNGAGEKSTNLINNVNFARGNNWINILLSGVESNKSAIGAIVKINSVIDGKPTWQIREVNAQNSFQSQNDLRLHFGLGKHTKIDTIIVAWPSGKKQIFMNVTGNTFYELSEGGTLKKTTINSARTSSGSTGKNSAFNVRLIPNPAFNELAVQLSENMKALYQLTSSDGSVIRKEQFTGSRIELNISNIKPGRYYLSVQHDGETVNEEFIKL